MTEPSGTSADAMNIHLSSADPALVGNDALLAAVFAGSGDCIKILDLDGRLQFMSEGGRRVMEVDDFAALKGCPWPDFWTNEGNLAAQQAVEDVRNGKSARFLGPANTARGNPKYWDVRVMPILGPDGKPTHLLSISTDITEQKEAELALRESEVRLKLALAAADTGVWQCDVVNGKFANLKGDDRAISLLGFTPGESSGFETFLTRVAHEDRSRVGLAAAQALGTEGDGILDVEYRICSDDSLERWVHARAQALPSSVGKRLIGTVRDITQRKESEARQAVLSGELQHRIKNSLAMVSAIASQTLKGDDIVERRQAFTGRLEALAHAHDMLTTTVWESAAIQTVIETALTPHMSGTDRFVLDGVHLELSAKQSVSLSLTVHELATNAAKYGAMSVPGGKVHICWGFHAGDDGEQQFKFVWKEHGGPQVKQPERLGFGSRMITRVLAADFKGEVGVDYAADGVVCTLTSPASVVRVPRRK
ncbi:HWE histidine kinase domain-containing protein [Devosia sp. RR2S18]|uniref:HWE histidine kinase domain-containing protein n=1 Tax=Devosia rhizosphaerae TaxID=3049774 RepID=UPI002540E627|nr:HWE histidine kinase domain-containing protein [Devosia sp. RR2S18]WIJ24979.1 HWE histidine kinase domain-containing protein [Devosia sp. RR2S18]